MGSRTTPIPKESYWHWLLVCGRATLPQANDWRGAWRDAVDLAHSLGFAVCMTLARLVLLLALPVSVPMLALVAMKANHRAADARAKARAELIDSLQSLQKKEPQ